MPLPISRPAASASWLLGVIPTPDDDRVGLDVAAVGQPHAVALPARAGDLADLHPEAQVHAVLAVQAGEDLGDLGAEHPQQRQFRRLQYRDLDAGGAGRGGGLQADPAPADHRDPGRGLQSRLDLVAVADASQVQHAVQVGARHREPARRGAGGQQ